MASPLAGPSPLRDELGRLLVPGSVVSKRVGFVSRRLARVFRLGRQAREDLAQEVALHLVKVLPKFDPDRGSSLEAFMLGVIRLWYRWRARQLKEQNARQITIGDQDVAWISGADVLGSRCAFDLISTRLDLDTVIAALPPEMAALAQLLGRCTIRQIADLDEEHRTTTWRKVQQLRAHVEQIFPEVTPSPCNNSPQPTERSR